MFDRTNPSAVRPVAAGTGRRHSQAFAEDRRRSVAYGGGAPIRSALGRPAALRLASRLAAALGLLLLAAALVRQADAGDPAETFVQRFADRSLAVLSAGELSDSDRRAALRRLLAAHFDLAVTGRFVLGRHWRRATLGERREYLALFEAFVAATTLRRLEGYAGETAER